MCWIKKKRHFQRNKVRQTIPLIAIILSLTLVIPMTSSTHFLAKKTPRGHPLSTYVKFSEKLTFLTLWYAQVRVRIRGLEMLVFRKILRTYLMDDPLLLSLLHFLSRIYSAAFPLIILTNLPLNLFSCTQ